MLSPFRSRARQQLERASDTESSSKEENPKALSGWYWTQHPLVRERVNKFASGEAHLDVYGRLGCYLAENGMASPLPTCATIGCGQGGLERDLLSRGLVGDIVGYDTSESHLGEAKRLSKVQGCTRIRYELSDPAFQVLPERRFDAIFSHGLVSHAVNLEEIFASVARALKPGGIFHINEFVGPSRFQWTDLQIQLVNEFLQALPNRLRQTPIGPKPLLQRSSAEGQALASCSAEIVDRLARWFEIVECRFLGGSLLHMALGDIAQNFDSTNPSDVTCLARLFELEDRLTWEGALSSDFAVLTAHPRLQGPLENAPKVIAHALGASPTRRLLPKEPPRLSNTDLTVSVADTMLTSNDTHYVAVGESALDVIGQIIGTEEPSRILDLPCGFGRVTRALRARYPAAAITASDLDRPGVDFVEARFGARGQYSVLDFDELELGEIYDLIWVGSLITHLPAHTTKRFLAALKRHLAPRGTAFITLQGPSVIPRLLETGYGLQMDDASAVIEDYERLGFGYRDYVGGKDLYGVSLSNEHYGISLTGEPWIRTALQDCGLALRAYLPRAWDAHHDVVAVQLAAGDTTAVHRTT